MVTSKISLLRLRAVTLLLLLALAETVVPLSSTGLAAAEPPRESKPADEITTLLKAQLTLAQKGYASAVELLTRTEKVGERLVWSGKPEDVYRWSVSWLQAQRELSPNKEEQVAALEAHLKRMTELHKRIEQLTSDVLPRQAVLEVERYRLEAQLWLAKAKPERPTFRLIQPQVRNISRTVGQPGFVEAYERTSIVPKVTGYIEKWNVDIGDRVKKGDVLATLFVPELREDWETKKAQVKRAQERVELAKQTVKVRQADVKAAQAHLAEARAPLKSGAPRGLRPRRPLRRRRRNCSPNRPPWSRARSPSRSPAPTWRWPGAMPGGWRPGSAT